jgi:hypothetical protein
LQTKTVTIGSTQGEDEEDEWSNFRLKATLKLRSNDVVEFVKSLTLDHGVFKFPPPARVTNYFKDLRGSSDEDLDSDD